MSTPWAPADPVPDHILLDRVYVHGGPTQDLQGALQANWSNAAIVDSYVSDVHIKGFDSFFTTMPPASEIGTQEKGLNR